MENGWDKFGKALEEWVESDAGKAYFEHKQIVDEINAGRQKRLEEYIKTHDFDKLMYRLILEHGEEWREKCYSNGYEPYPNNKLMFLMDYIFKNLAPIKVPQLDNPFNNEIWFFKGYYFQATNGQGTVFDIYNGDDFRHLLHT